MKFASVFGWFKNKKMDKVELAVLRVSMLVAALDGDVSKDELAEFSRLAMACADYSKQQADQAFLDTLRSAGYLMLMARVVEREALLEAFVVEVERIFPVIADFGPDRMTSAIATWKEMANADGDFSEVEQQAIDRVEQHFVLRNKVQADALIAGMGVGNAISTPF